MAYRIEKPTLNGKTPEENVAILESWANRLVDEVMFAINDLEKKIKEREDG